MFRFSLSFLLASCQAKDIYWAAESLNSGTVFDREKITWIFWKKLRYCETKRIRQPLLPPNIAKSILDPAGTWWQFSSRKQTADDPPKSSSCVIAEKLLGHDYILFSQRSVRFSNSIGPDSRNKPLLASAQSFMPSRRTSRDYFAEFEQVWFSLEYKARSLLINLAWDYQSSTQAQLIGSLNGSG